MDKITSMINQIILERSDGEDKPLLTELKPEISLRNDLSFSSLELASLTVMIEDEFGIDIFEDGIVNTIGEIIDILKRSEG